MSARLVAATSAHFAWARAAEDGVRSDDGLRLPPGGLESARVLAWQIVDGDEVRGPRQPEGPPRGGAVEIGYGVAESRRACGHATRAVALVIAELRADRLEPIAETTAENRASQLVLERNGFVRCGERVDPDDGALVTWRLRLGA